MLICAQHPSGLNETSVFYRKPISLLATQPSIKQSIVPLDKIIGSRMNSWSNRKPVKCNNSLVSQSGIEISWLLRASKWKLLSISTPDAQEVTVDHKGEPTLRPRRTPRSGDVEYWLSQRKLSFTHTFQLLSNQYFSNWSAKTCWKPFKCLVSVPECMLAPWSNKSVRRKWVYCNDDPTTSSSWSSRK